jgi:hypothetical protein
MKLHAIIALGTHPVMLQYVSDVPSSLDVERTTYYPFTGIPKKETLVKITLRQCSASSESVSKRQAPSGRVAHACIYGSARLQTVTNPRDDSSCLEMVFRSYQMVPASSHML